ncbi:MAG: ankyrin repeat domain-containing protein [Cocleimonas sp.]
MQKQLTRLLFLTLFVLPVTSNGGPTYNFDELSNVLQLEYRSQLNQNNVKKRASKRVVQIEPRKKPTPAPRASAHQNQTKSKVRRQVSNVAPRATSQPENSQVPDSRELFSAASSGNNQIIAGLLQRGLNINVANAERETALHMAAAHGHYSTVIYLINHGAYLHARTVKNWLPLHHATRFRHANIANYLKKRGSSVYARTSDGMSAIDMAKSMNDKRLQHVLGAR